MSFVNNAKPVAPPPKVLPNGELWGPEPYDINFAFALYPATLENDRVRIEPFVPRVHAEVYWETIGPLGTAPYRFYPNYPASLPEFLTFVELTYRRPPEHTMFAIIDKTRPDPARPGLGGSLAGHAGFGNASRATQQAELAHIQVLPQFRGTHVARDAIGLLLRYCLQLPTQSPAGLGLRRVAWCAHPGNAPSVGLARKMGFKEEGVLRWHRVLTEELWEAGDKEREGDHFPGRRGRHTITLSVCWDDWENGVNNHVAKLIDN